MQYGLLFPGQGAQFVGMGSDVFAARPDLVGATANEILGWDLERVCIEGPEDELTRTDRAQPALYALAFALWDLLRKTLAETPAVPPPTGAAGHSLGEYTALAAAGAIDYLTGLRLVATRGRAMADAAAREPSGMAALLGTDAAGAEAIAAKRRDEGGRLWVANLNAPGQIVLAGAGEDIGWVVENAREMGARRAVILNVSGAFHSPFMEPAAAQLGAALAGATFTDPAFPVWANTTASPRVADRAASLTQQLTAPVRFEESLEHMAGAGVRAFVHVGPGDVTAGMARRTVSDATVLTVSSVGDIEGAVEGLATTVQ